MSDTNTILERALKALAHELLTTRLKLGLAVDAREVSGAVINARHALADTTGRMFFDVPGAIANKVNAELTKEFVR